MYGTAPPLVTPFDQSGNLDLERLSRLVGWFEDRGVHFLVPCGSTSEAVLMNPDERANVIETVVDQATVPVIAGTGHPGLPDTLDQTRRAADAGADAAMVVTPFYHNHSQTTLEAYYTDLADESPLPIYLYSVPVFTGVALEPDTIGRISQHENVHGMKDSSGNLDAFHRTLNRVPDDFNLFTGGGGIYAATLDAGGAGGILGVTNIAPERTSELYDHHADGNDDRARQIGQDLVELNRAVTREHGIPGLKTAMRMRGAPAGYARKPHRPIDDHTTRKLESLVPDADPDA